MLKYVTLTFVNVRNLYFRITFGRVYVTFPNTQHRIIVLAVDHEHNSSDFKVFSQNTAIILDTL